MIYRSVDLYILKSILTSERISTWALGKKFHWDDGVLDRDKDEYYWRNKCIKIIKRLKEMEKEGLVMIFKNKHKIEYNLVGENVKMKRLKLPDGKYGNCLFVKETDSKWQMFEI